MTSPPKPPAAERELPENDDALSPAIRLWHALNRFDQLADTGRYFPADPWTQEVEIIERHLTRLALPESRAGEGTIMLRCNCVHGGGGHTESCPMYPGPIALPVVPLIKGPTLVNEWKPPPQAPVESARELAARHGMNVTPHDPADAFIGPRPSQTPEESGEVSHSIREGTEPIGKLPPGERFRNLMNGIADHYEQLSDEEVIEDAKVAGIDGSAEAARIRRVMLDAVRRGTGRTQGGKGDSGAGGP